jgi:hypothetical protein
MDDKTQREITSVLLLDMVSECPGKVLIKSDRPDWIVKGVNCGIEVTTASVPTEMRTTSLGGKKFKEIRSRKYSYFVYNLGFTNGKDFFEYNPVGKSIRRQSDWPAFVSLNDLPSCELDTLDSYFLGSHQSRRIENPHMFEKTVSEVLKEKQEKLNSGYQIFDTNILLVYCTSLLYCEQNLQKICNDLANIVDQYKEKFHLMYVHSFQKYFKFDLIHRTFELFEINDVALIQRRNDVMDGLIKHNPFDDLENLEKNLRNALENTNLDLSNK